MRAFPRIGLGGAVVMAIVLLAPSAGVATEDPLAAAQAKITAAQAAADKAAADYDAAQTHYYDLQDGVRRTENNVATMRDRVARLTRLVRARAVLAYMDGAGRSLLGEWGSSRDALDSARRAVLADRANAATNRAIDEFRGATSDLRDREQTLRRSLAQQDAALTAMRKRQAEVQGALDDATRAMQQLRARLENERRIREYTTLVRQAQAAAHARAQRDAAQREAAAPSPSSSGGSPGQIIGSGSWVCPVQGPVSFSDDFGAPRSGGRTHKGNDMWAPRGTPTVAVVAGSVFFQSDPLGGLAAYVQGNDGNTYYYAHLNDYVGGARSVAAGEVIGHVGNTGDASDAPPHLHFEIRLGGPNGTRIDPYSTIRAHC